MAVGDKYIIEVQAEFHDADYPMTSELYRIKGFNTIVFDHYGLNQLERLEEHDDALITKLAKNYYTKDHIDQESEKAYKRGYDEGYRDGVIGSVSKRTNADWVRSLNDKQLDEWLSSLVNGAIPWSEWLKWECHI